LVGWKIFRGSGLGKSRAAFQSVEQKPKFKEQSMGFVCRLWCEQEGQDIAEYAVMLAVILVIVVGTIRLIGSNANNVFSSVASSIQ
jgi:Flp pilus assembly pilin Flp